MPYRCVIPYRGDACKNGRMELLAFWALIIGLALFFELTTPALRRELLRSMWVVLFAGAALGGLWQLLH